MRSQIRPALVCMMLLTLITGVVYPAVVTGIAQAFPHQAKGSIVLRDGKAIGSTLIAQPFTHPKYFWPRPSAAKYDGAGGSGSNLALSNPALTEAINKRVEALKAADPTNDLPIPGDLVMASGSGLDPHISLEAARYQLARVARARHSSAASVEAMVTRCTEPRTFGLLGEPTVNVLKLNLALDHPEVMVSAAAAAAATQHMTRFDPPTLDRDRGFEPTSR